MLGLRTKRRVVKVEKNVPMGFLKVHLECGHHVSLSRKKHNVTKGNRRHCSLCKHGHTPARV